MLESKKKFERPVLYFSLQCLVCFKKALCKSYQESLGNIVLHTCDNLFEDFSNKGALIVSSQDLFL